MYEGRYEKGYMSIDLTKTMRVFTSSKTSEVHLSTSNFKFICPFLLKKLVIKPSINSIQQTSI